MQRYMKLLGNSWFSAGEVKMADSTDFVVGIEQLVGELEESRSEQGRILPAQDSGIQSAVVDISDHIAVAVDEDISSVVDYYKLRMLQRENIAQIVQEKNLEQLRDFGGVAVIAEALGSDFTDGISCLEQSVSQKLPSKFDAPNLFTSFLGACNNYTTILLLFSATLSLTSGILEQGFGILGCFDGAVVLLAVFILVVFRTRKIYIRDMRSQKKLYDFWRSVGGKMEVRVVSGGNEVFVPATDVQVGDMAILRSGDQVPADGIFAHGQELELEGSNTANIDQNNPFLFFGSNVINGDARMIVTSVGMDTVWGEMMIQPIIMKNESKCMLETMIHKLDERIQKFGIFMTILTLIWLLIRYTINGAKSSNTAVNTVLDGIKALITGSMFVGLLEGIPSFISVAFIIWNNKTLVGKGAVRDHLSCLKIASVTTVCTDKFGRLDKQEKEIDKLFVGGEFVCESSTIAPNILEGLCDGIGTLCLVPPRGCESKLTSLVSWAEEKLGMKKELVSELVSERCQITSSSSGCNPFQERCRVQIEKSGVEWMNYWLYRGPPQDILSLCSEYYDLKGNTHTLHTETRRLFEQATKEMLDEEEAIGFACGWLNESGEPSDGDQSGNSIFLGVIGLKDKNIEQTKHAVTTLKEGGIRIVLASEEDVTQLQDMAQNCGLLNLDSDDHLVVTAEDFRTWSDEEKSQNLEKISIIGNCLPLDKILLTKNLQERGQVVALIGHRTDDAPGLKQADIGLTFLTLSSEAARHCCDIGIWDSDFSVLVDVIENGRCFYENIQKFIQLELIITISSTLMNLTTTMVSRDAALMPIELFWLNLVVAGVGGLALLTSPSAEKLSSYGVCCPRRIRIQC